MSFESSEQINELATAFAKAQAEFAVASKDKENPHFKSSYADLTSCLEAVKGPLAAHSLSVMQLPRVEGQNAEVKTILLHASGQWISSTLSMPSSRNNAQGLGSALTYAKRYGLMAMLGITTEEEDDDGNAACASGQQQQKQKAQVKLYDNNNTVHQEHLVKFLDTHKVVPASYYEQVGKGLDGKDWKVLPQVIEWALKKIAEKEAKEVQNDPKEETKTEEPKSNSDEQSFNPFE